VQNLGFFFWGMFLLPQQGDQILLFSNTTSYFPRKLPIENYVFSHKCTGILLLLFLL